MAGIPSIVYGFFGLVVIVPIMQKLMGGSGKSVLTASILLGIMILPTVIGVAESSIRAVPDSYYEGALALGATRERSVFFACLLYTSRIIRDVKERGRDLDNIVEQYLTTVKPMHYLYVEPMRNRADIVVNSGMNDVAFDVVRSKIRDLLSE